jgi:hypothetical protein
MAKAFKLTLIPSLVFIGEISFLKKKNCCKYATFTVPAIDIFYNSHVRKAKLMQGS